MAPGSWAQIASFPKKAATSKAEGEEFPSLPAGPAVVVTGQQLEAGVKFSWSENPNHLQPDTPSKKSGTSASMETTKKSTKPTQVEQSVITLTPIYTVIDQVGHVDFHKTTVAEIAGEVENRLASDDDERAKVNRVPTQSGATDPVSDNGPRAEGIAHASEPSEPLSSVSTSLHEPHKHRNVNEVDPEAACMSQNDAHIPKSRNSGGSEGQKPGSSAVTSHKKTADVKGKGKANESISAEVPTTNTSDARINQQLAGVAPDKADTGLSTSLPSEQSTAPGSSSSPTNTPSNQDIETRIGNMSFSAAPDSAGDKPHPSGLTYQERYDLVRKRVQDALDLRRASELRAQGEDSSDIVFVFSQADGGIDSLCYHQEIVLRESGFLRERIKTAPQDGPKVSMYMGNWPIRVVDQVFNFMYTHKIEACEPPPEDDFYDMSAALTNAHQYILACAFDCPRQRQYHLQCLSRMVETAQRQSNGNYKKYQLAYWEFSRCEEKLRLADRCAFQERLYSEMMRPMRVLLCRLTAVMVPWLLRGKYMGAIMRPLWFEMKEDYIPWREAMWHYRAKEQIQADDWAWLGPKMTEKQISAASAQFGGGF